MKHPQAASDNIEKKKEYAPTIKKEKSTVEKQVKVTDKLVE